MNRLPADRIRKYFKKRPSVFFTVSLIIIGSLVFFAGFTQNRPGYPQSANIAQIAVVAGAVLFLIGFIRLFMSGGSGLRDSDIDNQFKNDLDEIAKRALDKLGLDEDDDLTESRKEPLILKGPILWETSGVNNKDLLWKKGKDNTVRFAINRVTVIYFSKHLLGAYACDFNFIKDVTLNERTDEYFYRDIVSVSTNETSTSYTLPNGTKLTHSREFRLSLSNGEAIQVFIDSGKLTKITQGNIPTEEAEKAVQIIRKILKEKKQ
jgi:hypothetical protein